jgi:uncharacterized protein YjbI with pentapeptide repeats
MNGYELLKRYASGERDFAGTNLAGLNLWDEIYGKADLSGIDLQNANLKGANLRCVAIRNANLQGADLSDADLTEVDLSGTNLSGANLSRANLNSANLSASNCQDVDFSDAQLTGYFNGANLKGSKLRNASLPWYSLQLNHADLSGVDLSGMNLVNVELNHARLTDANLSNVNLGTAKLAGTNFSRANLRNANLENANLQGSNFTSAHLSNAKLKNANLAGSDIRHANLERADLAHINLSHTTIDGAIAPHCKSYLVWQIVNQGAPIEKLRGCDLSKVNLQGIDLSGVNLSGANFRNTNLSKAKLRGSNLSHVNFNRANLISADLEKADLSYACLGGANLESANLNRANLSYAYLFGANLEQAKLQGANLKGANLTGTQLKSADLMDTELIDANLNDATLVNTNLSNARNASAKSLMFLYPTICCEEKSDCNQELLQAIVEAVEDVSYPGSESDSFYDVIFWEAAERGELTVLNLLQAMGHLRILELDDFKTRDINELEWLKFSPYSDSETRRNYQETIKALRSVIEEIEVHLTNLKIYQLITFNPYSELKEMYYILMGNTPTGDCLTISASVVECMDKQYSSPILRVKDIAKIKPENLEVVATLKTAIANFDGFAWEIGEQPTTTLQNLLDTTGMLGIRELWDGFFGEDEEEDENAKKCAALIKSNLTNLRVYRLGAINVEIYLVGQTEYGDWIGLHTVSTER